MLKDSLTQIYRKVTVLQLLLVATVAAIAAIIDGSLACWSAASGGGMVLAGNLTYVLLARQSTVVAKAGDKVLGRHVIAEIAKVVVVIALVVIAFAGGWFDAAWMVVSMGIVLSGQLLAFLIIR